MAGGKVIITVDIDDAEVERCLTEWGYKVADGDAYYGGDNQGNARNIFREILENRVLDMVHHARRGRAKGGMMMELNEMQTLARSSALALELQTKKNQQLARVNADLRAGIAELSKENGDLKRQTVDILLSKDDELAMMAARCTALADQLEQAQKTLAATSRALNEKLAELDAARDWARAWKMAASKWFGRLAVLDKAVAVVTDCTLAAAADTYGATAPEAK